MEEQDVLGPAQKPSKDKFATLRITDVHKRILWTIILVAFWRVLSHLSLPGIDYDVISKKGPGVDTSWSRFSIFSLGLLPYVNAYLLIEMLALFIQPLKRWRREGTYEGRARLVRAARWMTLVIAIYHGNALLTGMAGMAQGELFIDRSAEFRALLLLTLVAGTFFTVWIADLISSKGVGHGVSVLIMTAYISRIPRDVHDLVLAPSDGSKLFLLVVPLLAFIGMIMLIVVMERTAKRLTFRFADGMQGAVPLKLTSAGTMPSSWADSTLALPLVLLSFVNAGSLAGDGALQWAVQSLYPGSLIRALVYSGLVVFFYYVFTAFFYDPREIRAFLIDRGASPDAPFDKEDRGLDRSMERMALIGSIYLIGLSFVPEGLWKWLGVPPILSGLKLLVVVCIVLDLVREITLRSQARGLVKIAEFHEPWKAGVLQSLLQANSIPSVVRGYHHRALLYFFGPYIEMSVYVADEHSDAAQEIAQQRLRLS